MEWFTVLTELGKGLLGAETARKQGEINALLQLFGLEGEKQRRRLAEEEMALRREAHELQKKMTEGQLSMLPFQQELLKTQAETAKQGLEETRETAPLRKAMLESEAVVKKETAQRMKLESLYEQGATPDVISEDPDYTDDFKNAFNRYYLTRQYRERLPVIKSEEEIGDLIAMFPEESREQMLAIARFHIRENQVKDYLANLQMDTAEMQKYDTARKIALDTVFTVINRNLRWDAMKKEERLELLRKSIKESNLPPAIRNFLTDDMLSVFTEMNSDTANLARQTRMLGEIDFEYKKRLAEKQIAGELTVVRERGRQERALQQERFNQEVALGAFQQAQGRGRGGRQEEPPSYAVPPLSSFVKRGGNLNQYGSVLDKTVLDRHMQASSAFDTQMINMGGGQQVPFSVFRTEGYNAISRLMEPTFRTSPNSREAQQHLSNLIRYRYLEWQMSGLDANTAYQRAINETEEFINISNSPQLKNIWNQYKRSLQR